MILKLAWRNIWRNRRRALLTMASVFFAVFACVITTSFQSGVFERMIDNTLKTQTGHIQIHAKGYWDDKIIDNFMFMEPTAISRLEKMSGVENVSPRVETFAMAASDSVSKGTAVIGISPARESQKSNLPSRLVKGAYLSENDDGVLLGEGLAKYLKVTVGDTLALIGQGYHGASAAGLFPVRGILKLMTTEMDNVLYMTLPAAQRFIDMPDGYSGILISIKDNKRLDEAIRIVEQNIDTETLAVYSWHFTMERLLKTAELDKAMGVAIMYILYLLVGFGILGTVIMMTNERKREFGMMISLGMPRIKLVLVTALELLLMSLLGVALAFAVTLPITRWFATHPIEMTGDMAAMYIQYGMEPVLPMSTEPSIFIAQIEIVLVIVLLTAIYPVSKILRMKAIQ